MSNRSLTAEKLYERLLNYAKKCQRLVMMLPKTIYNIEYGKQLTRSSGSQGANYLEAIEAGSHREFIHKLKTCRKESRESVHWITLIEFANSRISGIQKICNELIEEGREYVKIFASSVSTTERNKEIKKSSK